jgi:endonuclease/exonuclease/phosphatase family metal-dependent hydrolase
MRERRNQAVRLAGADIINHPELAGDRVLLGDFNDWTRLTVVPTLISQLASADIRQHLRRRCTYPGFLPLLHLDHIYHDPCLQIEKMALHRSREARIASDHLPLVADFRASA